jgi:hypothetical protein
MSFTISSRTAASRWADAWLHSDLVGIPVTLAISGIIAVGVAPYLVIGNWAGLFVGKLFFPLALVGLIGLMARWGRRCEPTDGILAASATAPRRVLVLANSGLDQPALLADLCRPAGRGKTQEAMIIAPVAAASRLHALADDVDAELQAAQKRVHAVVTSLRRAGVNAAGRPNVARPATALMDGLREFAATDVVIVPSREKGWKDANTLAQQMNNQLGLGVTELDLMQIAPATAAQRPALAS